MVPSYASEALDLASCRKVAQLYAVIKGGCKIKYFERILQKEANINYDVKHHHNQADADGSLLHLAHRFARFDVFELLINNGADFTVQDRESFTVVHKIVQKHYKLLALDDAENKFVDCVLSAHVKFGNHSNPCCKDKISHFHVACARNNAKTVEFFLRNGIDVDQAVNVDSTIFAGYTPLHFAVKFSCLEVAKILLKYGSNVHVKNAAGLRPLDQLMKRKIDGNNCWKKDSDESVLTFLAKYIIDKNEDLTRTDDFGLSNLHLACIIKDTSVLESLLEKISIIDRPAQKNLLVCPGFTPLHFAAISSVEAVKLLLDKGADIGAKDVNGTTPFELCLQNWNVEDIHQIISSQPRWRNTILSDGKTKLLEIVIAMTNVDEFSKLLENIKSIVDLIVPMDSPLWPGYTILHLAVIFSEKAKGKSKHMEKKIIEECLLQGAKITKADANDSTALHLAFHLQQFFTVQTLLQHHQTTENPTDQHNLSYFHIACAADDESAVKRFISSGMDVNVPINSTVKWHVLDACFNYKPRYFYFTKGFTALHISVVCGNEKICKMLLDNGANIYATDVHGFTPVHLLFPNRSMTHHDKRVEDLLLNFDGLQDRTTEGGLTHLHVACYLSKYPNVKVAERLLDSRAFINAAITYNTNRKYTEEDSCIDVYGDPSKEPLSFLSRYRGFTPLHFSMQHYNHVHLKFLIRKGADLFAGNSCASVPIEEILKDTSERDMDLFSVLMNSDVLFSRLKKDYGITRLHIACYATNLEWIQDSLSDEDVNSRIDEKSLIWPGNTSLHLAARNVINVNETHLMRIFEVLLRHGADVTSKNQNGDTPLHLISRQIDGPLASSRCAYLLLDSLKDFDVEEAHLQNMSFFHFACLLKHVPIVQKYLTKGIDVNKPIDYFDERYPGCSPLHLAIGYGLRIPRSINSQMKVVELLLKYGANVRVKDVYENTLLHKAAGLIAYRQQLFDIFIRDGVDVNAENIFGETALEILIKSRNADWEQIKCFIKHGSRINSFNSMTQEGYIAMALEDPVNYAWRASDDDIIRNLIDSEYVTELDNKGRSILHNLVSISYFNIVDYVKLIGRLIERGCNINLQDKNGRTALHTATWFRNSRAVVGLLKNGADINMTDKNGKTAFTYIHESPHDHNSSEDYSDPNHVMNIFAMHVHKMERCRLYISEVNKRLQTDTLRINNLDEELLNGFNNDVRKSKYVSLGSTDLTLYDFGFKMDAEMVYPSMSILVRQEIDQFFKNIHQHNLPRIDYMLKQKYANCVERLRLIDFAVEPFSSLIKNELPDLCCRVVLSFLSRSDLKNVIALKNL